MFMYSYTAGVLSTQVVQLFFTCKNDTHHNTCQNDNLAEAVVWDRAFIKC